MIDLETDDHQRLVDLLKDLPEMATEASRKAIFEYAGLKELLSMIDLSGTPFIAANHIVSNLSKRGCLGLLLNSIKKTFLGVDEQEILDGLLTKYNMLEYNMIAQLPRIFVSHNTEGTIHEKLVSNICNELSKDFKMITDEIDEKEQREKDNWRYWRLKLLKELGKCDAGIIFLNDQNCTDLNCVHTATILRWRDWIEKEFKLIIVCLGKITGKHTCEGGWARLSFSDTEKVIVCESKEDEILEKINRQLDNLRKYPCKRTRVERMEDALTDLLKKVEDKKYLKEAINEILNHKPIEHGYYNYNQSQLPIERCLTHVMLREGISSFDALINTLKARITPVSYRIILELIAPSWVDLRAAGLIAKNIIKKRDERIFCVNGSIPNFTGEMYVRQACHSDGGPDYSWKVIQVIAADGDNLIEFIINQIRKGLINKFRSTKKRYSHVEEIDEVLKEEIDKMINQRLEKLDANKEPTFVVFPPDFEISEELLEQVRRSYPSLTFFLLTGCETTDPPFDHIELLEPFLSPGVEYQACQEYEYNSDLIPSVKGE